jgi:tetratricopeptide (TPR) repeat protein
MAVGSLCVCLAHGVACGAESKPLTPFEIANRLYEQGKYAEAERSFRAVLGQPLDVPTRGKATFNLALTLQKLRRYDEAIKILDHLLAQPVNDREPGGHLMEPYRNYRPRAQWEIGDCHFAKKEYQAALRAYRTTKEKFRQMPLAGVAAP